MAKPKSVKDYNVFYAKGGRGFAGGVKATSPKEAKWEAASQWGGRPSDYRTVKISDNPARKSPKGWIDPPQPSRSLATRAG